MVSLLNAFNDMPLRAWQIKLEELVSEHDLFVEGGELAKFEVKLTRLEDNAAVVAIRNALERHRLFEAEKRFVMEATAGQKDAEANWSNGMR